MRKTEYFLIKHSRGNHSATQVYWHGEIEEQGTKKLCQKRLVEMRRFCKIKYTETSTNDTLTDFVRYEMSNIFLVQKTKENQIIFSY